LQGLARIDTAQIDDQAVRLSQREGLEGRRRLQMQLGAGAFRPGIQL
jgi:hypothetical protein